MTYRLVLSVAVSLMAALYLTACAQGSLASGADQTVESLAGQYAPGTITSTEVADRALDDVKRHRALAETRFAEDEAICYEKFFVTSCMDAAKNRKRMSLKQLNTIEVEANAYHRRARVEQKDQMLRERQTKQETEAAERADTQKSGTPTDAPTTSQDIAEVENRSRQAAPPASARAKNYNAERAARHEEELKKEREKESVQEKKREENIKTYEKKRQRSLERQREIAVKKEKGPKEQQEAGGKSQ